MKRFCRDFALFAAVGILPGTDAFLFADTPSPLPLPPAERAWGEGPNERQVNEKAAPAKSDKEIKRLIGQLGSERFEDRQQATQELSKFGETALPSLKEAAQSADAEVRRRAQQLIAVLEPRSPPAQVQLKPAVKSYL